MDVDSLIIRPAEIKDAEAVQRIRKIAWQKRYVNPETGITEHILKTKLAKLPPAKSDLDFYRSILDKPQNKNKNLIAELNGRTIGVLTYDTLESGNGDIGVFVDDPYNGKGVGDMLIKSITARTNNELEVTIFAKNPSRDFYKKHGFKEFGEEFKHYFSDDIYLPAQTLVLNRHNSIS